MNLRSNVDRLVTVSVMGQVASPGYPGLPALPYQLSAEGEPFLLPAFGGIVYNVSVGDPAFGWLADCVHPGVSISLADDNGNRGLNILSCVGNEAVVMSGGAQGARGVVTGKSGRFADQVILHFPRAAREQLAIGDKIIVRAQGVGLQLLDHPDLRLKSCAPALLESLELTRDDDGRLVAPVVGTVPPHLLGAGSGLDSEGGSLHIQSADRDALAEAGLDALRLGDVVALQGLDSGWNHGYRRGALALGVVGQGDSPRNGYGPGVTVLMTSATGGIAPMTTTGVNLKALLNLQD